MNDLITLPTSKLSVAWLLIDWASVATWMRAVKASSTYTLLHFLFYVMDMNRYTRWDSPTTSLAGANCSLCYLGQGDLNLAHKCVIVLVLDKCMKLYTRWGGHDYYSFELTISGVNHMHRIPCSSMYGPKYFHQFMSEQLSWWIWPQVHQLFCTSILLRWRLSLVTIPPH